MTTTGQRRRCSFHGCTGTPKNADGFLCAPHWFALDDDLRRRIWQAHRAKDRATSLRLVREALDYLNRETSAR